MSSLKNAIREKCKDCTYDSEAPGTYLQQIEECTVKSCPLWEVRPVTVATISLRRKQSNGVIDSLIDSLEDAEPESVS